jgi:subtilisin family serine protease
MFRTLGSALAAGCLLLLSAGAGSASPAGTRIVVGYTEQGYSGAAALERDLDAEVIDRITPLRADVLRLSGGEPGAVLALLRSDPRVSYADFDGVVHALRVPNDEFLPTQWSIRKTGAEQAWDLSTGSSQVVVGILDTGVDAGQPDLRGKLVQGYDYVNNDQDPSDDNGHGTAVAGIVAASSDNGIGVAGYCWACRLMPVKVLGADGTGFMTGLAQGILWATDHGARVLNLSLGGPVEDLTLTAATQYAWDHGVLVVAAAGNESSSAIDYPAALANVLSVSASDQSDRLYAFSNSGARVAAPGENSTTGLGNTYVSFLGTSSAAPVVSGIAGLAFSLVPGATPAQVEQAIEASAVPIPGVTSGRVDAYGTLRTLVPGLAQPGTPTPAPGGQQQQGSGGAGATPTGGTPRTTKVVAGKVRRGRNASVVLTTGSGLLQATVRTRARNRAIRLRLLAAGHVVASARGAGGARLRAEMPAGRYRLVISTTSRKRSSFSLTISYPASL